MVISSVPPRSMVFLCDFLGHGATTGSPSTTKQWFTEVQPPCNSPTPSLLIFYIKTRYNYCYNIWTQRVYTQLVGYGGRTRQSALFVVLASSCTRGQTIQRLIRWSSLMHSTPLKEDTKYYTVKCILVSHSCNQYSHAYKHVMIKIN